MKKFSASRHYGFMQIFVCITICLLLKVPGFSQNYTFTYPEKHELLNKEAPVFSAQTLNGKDFHMTDYRGKVIVLHIWALTCASCYKEIKELNSLVHFYKDKMVLIISLMPDSTTDVFKKIENSGEFYKLKKPVYNNDNIQFQIIPQAKNIIESFETPDKQGVPMTFVIDEDGIIKEYSHGYRMSYGNPSPEESDNYKLIKAKIEKVMAGLVAPSLNIDR